MPNASVTPDSLETPLFARHEPLTSDALGSQYESVTDGDERAGLSCGVTIREGTTQPANHQFIWKLTFAAGISGLLFGYDTGVISSTLVSIGTDLSGRELSTLDKSLITSSTSLFALVSSPVAASLGDRLGRRAIIVITAALFVLGALEQALTTSVWGMIFGRSLVGLAVGAASLITPLYISELAPSHLRGRLVTTIIIFITGGQVVAYTVGWLFSTAAHGWRGIVGLGALPAAIQLILVYFLPDTPRWLVRAGQDQDARRVLLKVYGQESHNGVRTADCVLRDIERDIAAEEEELAHTSKTVSTPHDGGESQTTSAWKETWIALFYIDGNRRALAIACMLQALQQFCGFNSLMYYSATIFEELGFASPTLASLIVAVSNWAFTFVAFILIDRLGRRRILLYVIPVMTAALLLTAVSFGFLDINRNPKSSEAKTTQTSSLAPFFTLGFIAIYCAGYATSLGPIPWQQSELFPLRVRALGSGLATATNYTANFIVGATFLPLLDTVSAGGTFVLYAAICATGWVLIYRFYPEMSGMSLEDVRALLVDGWGVEESIERLKRWRMANVQRGYIAAQPPGVSRS
ncbi:hypothetical protein KEM54_006919 [Ascosphaera aggregata]|nr:hypothetical protein KEM54_006919 [Ascosphaera aggregata]